MGNGLTRSSSNGRGIKNINLLSAEFAQRVTQDFNHIDTKGSTSFITSNGSKSWLTSLGTCCLLEDTFRQAQSRSTLSVQLYTLQGVKGISSNFSYRYGKELTFCMLGNFACFFVVCGFFF